MFRAFEEDDGGVDGCGKQQRDDDQSRGQTCLLDRPRNR